MYDAADHEYGVVFSSNTDDSPMFPLLINVGGHCPSKKKGTNYMWICLISADHACSLLCFSILSGYCSALWPREWLIHAGTHSEDEDTVWSTVTRVEDEVGMFSATATSTKLKWLNNDPRWKTSPKYGHLSNWVATPNADNPTYCKPKLNLGPEALMLLAPSSPLLALLALTQVQSPVKKGRQTCVPCPTLTRKLWEICFSVICETLSTALTSLKFAMQLFAMQSFIHHSWKWNKQCFYREQREQKPIITVRTMSWLSQTDCIINWRH